DSLIGPWPEREEIYRERSPLFHAERIHAPVIFFQGLDDKVVLPEQSQMMVEELRHNHVPVSYIAFPDEGHGFRNADNIERAIQAEWYFYSRILGFPLPEPIEPVAIDNLP
ncbi:MAG: prolyl oligopeptidase family serine peptidase, partial [Firmicutes bacterium]|nr:prolyl oligopeptidase family serine peptidase [Bacillota bacterium]